MRTTIRSKMGVGLLGFVAGLLSLLPAVGLAAEVVVPNAQATVEGNTTGLPTFACLQLSSSARYQQVYRGSEVGSGIITQIAFRQDGDSGLAFGPVTISGVTITLSSTSKGPDTLSQNFADNVGLARNGFSSGPSSSFLACNRSASNSARLVFPTPIGPSTTMYRGLGMASAVPTCWG